MTDTPATAPNAHEVIARLAVIAYEHRTPDAPVVLWVDGNPREVERIEYDEDVRVVFLAARRQIGLGDRLTDPRLDATLAPDDYRRWSSSAIRGALAWALYASETGDEEGGDWETARDALGRDVARELERRLVATAPVDDAALRARYERTWPLSVDIETDLAELATTVEQLRAMGLDVIPARDAS